MWRKLRIFILLFILATVAHRAWLQDKHLEWKDTLYVAVYPIAMHGSAASSGYLASLDAQQFQQTADYLAEEAQRYGVGLSRPFELKLGPVISELPPQPPRSGEVWEIILWSLQFRWWSWHNSPALSVPADIQLYLIYHDPAQQTTLSHSTALNKGRLGLVNLFADTKYESQNAVIVAHELLHTLGASDKYNLSTNQPFYPEGFAEPQKNPLYPQDMAELMAGRLPRTANKSEIPTDLSETLIGEKTAFEIGWIH